MKKFRPTPWAVQSRTGVYLITSLSGLVDAACFIGLGHLFAEKLTGNLGAVSGGMFPLQAIQALQWLCIIEPRRSASAERKRQALVARVSPRLY